MVHRMFHRVFLLVEQNVIFPHGRCTFFDHGQPPGGNGVFQHTVCRIDIAIFDQRLQDERRGKKPCSNGIVSVDRGLIQLSGN